MRGLGIPEWPQFCNYKVSSMIEMRNTYLAQVISFFQLACQIYKILLSSSVYLTPPSLCRYKSPLTFSY